MDHVTFVPTVDQLNYTFGGAAPVTRIRPGTVLTLWTEDAYGGRITSRDDVASTALDTEDLNPQTGNCSSSWAPNEVTRWPCTSSTSSARTWGASTLIPFFGGLTSIPVSPTLQDPLPERTYIYDYDAGTETLGFSALASDFTVLLPANPMLGTVGGWRLRAARCGAHWCPPTSAATSIPRMWSATRHLLAGERRAGVVRAGDGRHYRQGEGESCGTAVEGAMNVTAVVELIKVAVRTGPAWKNQHAPTVPAPAVRWKRRGGPARWR